jgi:adenine-specific DNA-methyltransferase
MKDNKKNGVYYTPSLLADFLIRRIIRDRPFKKDIRILEPSCGDGVFVRHLLEKEKLLGSRNCEIDLVEKNAMELKKVSMNYGTSYLFQLNYYEEDYLNFQKRITKKYDLIIGNPPYINKKVMEEEQIALAEEILKGAGFKPYTIKNIWIAFLVSAVEKVECDGILCFVLPAEIMQVKHSEKIREYLIGEFEYIEVYTFKELLFQNTDQDTVVFIGYKKHHLKGLAFHKVQDVTDIENTTESVLIEQPVKGVKWTNYFLSIKDLTLLDSWRKKCYEIHHYGDTSVGIVTAANDFFIVDERTLSDNQLNSLAIPILKKGSLIDNTVRVTQENMDYLSSHGHPTNLLLFGDQPIEQFDGPIQTYLNQGVENEIHKRYKCKKRKNWYVVPSIWKSEAMFFKRSHLFPKLVVNEADVYTTDTAYRINMKNGHDIYSFVFSFYNTLTLIYTELDGRYYGGGVLELTPNEFKSLPLPYVTVNIDKFLYLDNLLRQNKPINEVLEYTNKIILMDQLGMTEKEVHHLNTIYLNLVSKRIRR